MAMLYKLQSSLAAQTLTNEYRLSVQQMDRGSYRLYCMPQMSAIGAFVAHHAFIMQCVMFKRAGGLVLLVVMVLIFEATAWSNYSLIIF